LGDKSDVSIWKYTYTCYRTNWNFYGRICNILWWSISIANAKLFHKLLQIQQLYKIMDTSVLLFVLVSNQQILDKLLFLTATSYPTSRPPLLQHIAKNIAFVLQINRNQHQHFHLFYELLQTFTNFCKLLNTFAYILTFTIICVLPRFLLVCCCHESCPKLYLLILEPIFYQLSFL
jgi:hypothetical protein